MSTRKLFSKKHHKREVIDLQYFLLVVYIQSTTKFSYLLISPMGLND